MRTQIPSTPRLGGALPAAYAAELDSFLLSLEAENLAPKTQRVYAEAADLVGRFLAERGMPTDPVAIRREHVEAFIADQVARWRPNTARNRYLALRRFFRWLADESLIEDSPMVRMRPPRVPDEPVPILTTDEAVRALLHACEGRTFADRRDTALIRLLLDSGARRSEVAALTPEAVDLRDKTATVLGKGRRPRTITFGARTALAIDRYLRERRLHRDAERPDMWLGHRGPVTSDGIADILERRCVKARLPRVALTRSAICSPTRCSARACRRPISCAWPAGAAARWSLATPLQPGPIGLSLHIAASRRVTASDGHAGGQGLCDAGAPAAKPACAEG